MNILSQITDLHSTIPFEEIKLSAYKPAFLEAINIHKKEIEKITTNTENATFENTIVALEVSGNELNTLSALFFNLNSAETSDEMQQLAQEIMPILTQHSNSILLNERLFQRIETVYTNCDKIEDLEDLKLIESTYKSFSNNGAHLPQDKKEQLKTINEQLAQLSLQFGENVLAETNSYQLHITEENNLAGLPETNKNSAAQLAKDQGKEGWIFTLHPPSYMPFMTYIENQSLREKLFLAYNKRAFNDNKSNNEKLVLQIAKLRNEKAQILGYTTYAESILVERMAENPVKVNTFLNDLAKKAKPFAEKEIDALTEIAKEDGITQLQKWDHAYYAEKLKNNLFQFNDELLKPYFKLENVIEGVFKITERLFDLTYIKNTSYQKYHPDVTVYDVYEFGQLKAILYTDFFPRKGKRGGAWMTSYKNQSQLNGNKQIPHISIVCNFSPSTPEIPSLLTFNEVTTLFHEFGHALHGMLANTKYKSLSGTNVYWDFVELPSQLLENWCYEKEALDLFAIHYKTQEPIPKTYIEKITHLKSFMEGYQTMRQISFGILDQAWHGEKASEQILSVAQFEEESMQDFELYPKNNNTNMSVAFSHIFQGGYAAAYYSYKWAEVLDADAFAYFKENGIFNKTIATQYKETVLSKGGTINPMELYKKFRGKEPIVDNLLIRAGLVHTN